MNFKSLPQLLDHFKKESTCIAYYEKLRWNGNPVCPHCGASKPYKTSRGYKCSNNECYKKFTVKVGSIFESSKIPFRTWFAAIYLCSAHKKGISSVQLSIDLNVTQKTAWFMLHRIREMFKSQRPELLGRDKVVESDEVYIGGKEENRHTKKRRSDLYPSLAQDGTLYNKKKIVIGIIERNGKVILKHIPNATTENVVPFIQKHAVAGSRIITDEHTAYSKLNKTYTHETVVHSLRIYVDGTAHTNTMENFWSVLKRGLCGIYHQVSDKHLERYLDEFAARFNTRLLASDQRFEMFLSKSEGNMLYKNLIAND